MVNILVSFYLWLTGSVLKHCKVPKYYDHDCLKIFFLLSTLPAMIRISGKKHSFDSKKFFQKLVLSASQTGVEDLLEVLEFFVLNVLS